MPTCNTPGDTVVCKVEYGKILYASSLVFEFTRDFYILCCVDNGYLISVPTNLFLKNSFVLTLKDCKSFGLLSKFVDATVHHINDDHIVSVRNKLTGLPCMICETFHEYAEVNRLDEDGKGAYICWNCRSYPFYK